MKKSTVIILVVTLLILQALALYLLGHSWICECGYVKLWHGVVKSSENSQHISDWYSFSHIIHGFLFYFLGWVVRKKYKKIPVSVLFVVAVTVEVLWEIIENTPFTINRYRVATISLDYYGDSIINSLVDNLFMACGFLMAYRFPVWLSISLVLAMEIFVGWEIRDNLTLNIIMLIHPFKSILLWQSRLAP